MFGTNQPGIIPVLRGKIEETRGPLQRLSLRFQVAHQLLLAGDSKQALQELESRETSLAELTALPADQKVQEAASLQGMIGIAALRVGEQENCLLNHRAYSCLFPIERAGVHTLQSGSRRAIEAFKKQLALEPKNLGAAWLLNLAYMTVGEYPQQVPPQWLISPDVFRSAYDINRFPDVAMATGVDGGERALHQIGRRPGFGAHEARKLGTPPCRRNRTKSTTRLVSCPSAVAAAAPHEEPGQGQVANADVSVIGGEYVPSGLV